MPKKISAGSAAPLDPAKAPRCRPPGGDELLTISRLARELGVAADHVERLQSTTCVAGEDFIDVDGAAVFTGPGAQKIRALVAAEMRATLPPAAAEPPAPPATALPATPGLTRADLRLTRVFPWSCNLLAVLPNDNEVVVTVRSNKHLQAGMLLRGCIQGELGWTYEGTLPRRTGEQQLYFPPKPAAPSRPTKGKK